MFPSPFEYHRPGNVADAVRMLASNPDAKLLAGGHSLIPAMKLRLAAPGAIVDISRLTELKRVTAGNGLTIGALATYDDVRNAAGVSESYPILGESIGVIGDQQVRAHGTIGGSLAHADPAADMTAVILALGADLQVTGSNGERTIAVDDLFLDLWTTSLETDEIITSVTIPAPAAGTVMGYEKMAHPASGYAIVGVALVITAPDGNVSTVRIAVTGATSKAVHAVEAERALIGKPLNAESIAAAAKVASNGLDINGDHYASEAYRTHLIKVLTQRGLTRISAQI